MWNPNRERREPYKEVETLWRCLSCGKLYSRPDDKGATCPKCKPPSKVKHKAPEEQ